MEMQQSLKACVQDRPDGSRGFCSKRQLTRGGQHKATIVVLDLVF